MARKQVQWHSDEMFKKSLSLDWPGLVCLLTCLLALDVLELQPYTPLFLLSDRPARMHTRHYDLPLT
jgi:hypothetical protein